MLVVCCLVGCKAQPSEQHDAASYDLTRPGDGFSDGDLAGIDGPIGSDLACPVGAVEICGNGCDDDGNGYTDADDPACTPQVVATWELGSPSLTRMILQPPYATRVLDGNLVGSGAHATYSRAFAPGVAFLVIDGTGMELDRITMNPGGKGAIERITTSYFLRDVCVFNGELIVVERDGKLHRLSADGKSELGVVQLAAWMPSGSMRLSACATDGTYLYIAEHAGIMPTQFEQLDNTFARVTAPVPISDQLLNAGIDRCTDFAWARGGFYGLFLNSGGQTKDELLATQFVSFALDGAVGPPIDAGTLHGLGEFVP